MVYKCVLCTFEAGTLISYSSHYALHRNVPNFSFPCAYASCGRAFKSYAGFKTHIFRDHTIRKHLGASRLATPVSNTIICSVSECGRKFPHFRDLIQHVKEHVEQGKVMPCPYANCINQFKIKSTFSSHLSRKHPHFLIKSQFSEMESINRCYIQFDGESESNSGFEIADTSSTIDLNTVDDEQASHDGEPMVSQEFDTQFLDNIGLLYMKLQAQLLLPSSTIQVIVEEFANANFLNQESMKVHLKEHLIKLNLPCENVTNILNDLSANDLFARIHNPRTGLLRSEHARFKFFKERFKFVSPVQVNLGRDASNKPRCYHYIPIKESLSALINDASVEHQLHNPLPSRTNVLADLKDGKAYQTNSFFIENPGAIQIVLFQDAFELVNPLGSAKKKHKILGVYYTIGNIHAQYRSSVSQLQLILLCKEVDLKYFGVAVIFRKLLKDLQEIESVGLTMLSGQVIKGTVVAITGDNLGSHGIGGFVENFSTCDYICRYCDSSRSEWLADGVGQGCFRTEQSYSEAVETLTVNPELTDYHGIKTQSLFNSLHYFHVCQPGLPPCLAHDFFEGLVSYDLALMIKYFVRKVKWFTYDLLNSRIKTFPYQGSDARSKPCEVLVSGTKLGGQAAENWVLLRLLGLITDGLVKDVNDPVWQMYLNLCDVVTLVCAPNIDIGQLSLMKTLIDDYLECRLMLFPNIKLRPKHHYISHYPILTLYFGPLIHLWTMRFESKHSYFKRAIRNLRSFNNVTLTLANRHQLLQCYQMVGRMFSSDVDALGSMPFDKHLYSTKIQTAVSELNVFESELQVCSQISVHGTAYKTGLFVMMHYFGSQCDAIFGKIILVLVHKGSSPVFIVELHTGNWESAMNAYHVVELPCSSVKCMPHSEMVDYYPLTPYVRSCKTYVVLKHTCVPSESGFPMTY